MPPTSCSSATSRISSRPSRRSLEGNERETTIVSILAGVTLDALRSAYPGAASVVRLMPNVAVEIGRGVICVAA